MAKGNQTSLLGISKSAIDPTLDALFSASAGPVQRPPKSRYLDLVRKRTRNPSESEASSSAAESSSDDDGSDDEGSGDDESDSGSSVTSSDEGDASDDASEDDVEIESEELEAMEGDELEPTAPLTESKRARKRKRDQEEEALENEYVQRLHEARDEERRDSKRAKQANGGAKDSDAEDSDTEDSENEDSDDKDKDAEDTDSESDAPPMHESLVSGEDKAASSSTAADLERASRTVFLGNVSTTAITSPSARRTLEKHLSSVLNPDPEDEGNNDEHSSSSSSDSEDGVDAKQSSDSNGAAATAKGRTKRQVKRRRIESLRFRSIPFATTSMPKRAAYATSAIMTATTAATHAYAVYPTEADARLAVSRLNGTIVLGRHLRADSVAHPSPVDHRRCVFVGNLNFVDDESVYRTRNVEEKDEDGDSGKRKKGGKFRETTREKRTKVPGDVEEGLWRVFGEKAGKVESVRVVRDEKTRVGKGFAYVQFYDANAVELALLLDGQKFPPMIPRPLRVARAKAPHKTALAMERAKNGKVRDDKTNGRSKKILDSSHSRIDKLVGQETAARERRRELGVGEFRSSRHSANKDGHVDKQQGKPKGTFRTPETIVFEGRRASEKDGRPAGLVKTKGKGGKSRAARKGGPASKAGGVTKSRGARRAAEWRKVKGSARA